MTEYRHVVNGQPCTIYFPEREEDLEGFYAFLGRPRRVLAVDTETTGLAWDDHVRLVQFGDLTEAWVLAADQFRGVIMSTMFDPRHALAMHNATFDIIKMKNDGLIDHVDSVCRRTFDTYIMAHLLDPRSEQDGGIGHGLKPLTAAYVDPGAEDTQKGLHAVFRSLRLTLADGFAKVPLNHPTYVRYAGLDVIYTARLFEVLGRQVVDNGFLKLARFEHDLQRVLTKLELKGFLIDVPYTERLSIQLDNDRQKAEEEARAYGIDKVGSTAQVARALEAEGVVLKEKTPTGKPKVDSNVLEPLVDTSPVASAVFRAKRAAKWKASYVDAFLDMRDAHNRIHPHIKGLTARTGRMAISEPPLQQLPIGDWTIRRCFVADEGLAIWSADYAQIEMKILAALADEPTMKAAIAAGESLHKVTAKALFGEGYNKTQYRLAKNVGFGRVYGGGVKGIVSQTGLPYAEVKAAVEAYDRRFPKVKKFARRVVERAEAGEKAVVTPTGRRLPLDRGRYYAGVNFLCQSTARDVLAQAILELDEQGMTDYLLLPIHDELLGQGPEAEAADIARQVAETMKTELLGVVIDSEPEVYGRSWGHGYGATE